jgi:hypothetical protein
MLAENFIVAPIKGIDSSEKKKIPEVPMIEVRSPAFNPNSRKAMIHGTAMKSNAAIPQGSLTSGSNTKKIERVPNSVDTASSRIEKVNERLWLLLFLKFCEFSCCISVFSPF